MAEIAISIAAKLSEYAVSLVIHQGQYLFQARKITKNLETEKEQLVSTRDGVQKKVEQATNKTEKVVESVLEWIKEAEDLIVEVENLEAEVDIIRSCFQGKCSVKKRYSLFKKMQKKIEAMINLNKKGHQFETISFPAPIPDIEYYSSKDFEYFESTSKASQQLLAALQVGNFYMIGLYGMGGSGKTRLAIEVGKRAKALGLFDGVVPVTVSQMADITEIQGRIAEVMGLKFSEQSREGRAGRLSMRLRGRERVLVILDDVWGKLELQEIGIPCNGNQGDCKVLFATRLRRVCSLMKCQREVPLHLLSEDEAWRFFRKHSGIGDNPSSKLLNLAKEVAAECKGLPIAIEALGSSLKGKSISEWKDALRSLKHSKPVDVEQGQKDAFSCIELSYNHLRNKEAELVFLMCSLFPEDHEIFVEDLIRYVVGLGVCGEVESLDAARNQLRKSINKLVDSCLLMQSEKNKEQFSDVHRTDHVKMHDMVRDVALWIASKSLDRRILVNLAKDLNTLAENGDIKDYFAVSSWHKKTVQVAARMNAPHLEILLLNTRMSLDLMNASFEGIKGIKVMAITSEGYKTSLSFPYSIQSLTNLRTLRLRGWELGDISFVLGLIKLEVLDLQACCFKELPKEIERLRKLKLLDLSRCEVLENYNSKSIGNLEQLEELYVSGTLLSRDDSCICLSQQFLDDVTLPNLQRYLLELGPLQTYGYGTNNEDSSVRSLSLKEFDTSKFGAPKMNLLQRAEDIYLNRLRGGCKNFIPEFVQAVGSMNDLAKFRLRSCPEIEFIIDTTSDGSFLVDTSIPGLIKLELEEMENLEELCHGSSFQALSFFEKLEELHIRKCWRLCSLFPGNCKLDSLKILKIDGRGFDHSTVAISCIVVALFSMSVARSLQQLEELYVADCKELRHIISNEEEDISPALNNSQLLFPNLKKLAVHYCPKLGFVFPSPFVGLEKLQELEIFKAPEMKYIFGYHEHEDLSTQQQHEIQTKLPVLKVLKLQHLRNLLGICRGNNQPWWPSLQELSCANCPRLSESCIHRMVGSIVRQKNLNKGASSEDEQRKHYTPTLERVELRGFPELRFIWSDPAHKHILSLQYLQHLKVDGIEKLKSLFSMSILQSLPELTSLVIQRCEELEEILLENEEDLSVVSTKECFPKLRNLTVKKCNNLKSLFSVAMLGMRPQLSSLLISEADKLVEVFMHSSDDGITNNGENIVFPNLRGIKLAKLPNLVYICQGFKLQKIEEVEIMIDECPKFAPISQAT